MGRQPDWVLSRAARAKPGTSRRLRQRLAATTILAVAPFLGYGRQAYASCDASPSPIFICSGADNTTTQTINADDADVSTAADFSVITAAGNGIEITGAGYLQFIDENASTITGADNGLDVRSTGDSLAYNGAVKIETDGNITGGGYGIFVRNAGSGSIDVTADGAVTGLAYAGLYARNQFGGTDLAITTGADSVITGYIDGIDARNYGSGSSTIIANGEVTGASNGGNYHGIFARNQGTNLAITTGEGSVVTGGYSGISGINDGSGYLEIKAYGQVTAYNHDGIYARNSSDGSDLTVTAGVASAITGHDDGLEAQNLGRGNLEITTDGRVTGQYGDGIHAENSENGTYLKIETGANSSVTGYNEGIDARNYGTGNLEITVDGRVTGEYSDGIQAANGFQEDNAVGDLTVAIGAAGVVRGYDEGIDVDNYSAGRLEITVSGSVAGENGKGILAYNSARGLDLKITTDAGSAVTGIYGHGIAAYQYSNEKLEIIANGEVSGQGVDTATGRLGSGIVAEIHGTGVADVRVGGTGLVEGEYAGIRGNSLLDQGTIAITNDGTVRNLSTESFDRAIVTTGAQTTVETDGNLIGTVTTDLEKSFDDGLTNGGFWNTSNGANDFGLGDDAVDNTGTLLAADDPAELEKTFFLNLETFTNSGRMSMVDGEVGDSLILHGETPAALDYEGEGGTLAVDARLGPAGETDVFIIDGSTQGTTLVHVNVVDATGANLDGIPVVFLLNGGTTAEGNFNLDGPLNAGFFTWDLRLDDSNPAIPRHELFTSGIGVGSYEFAAGIGGAQEVWQQTTGTLLQRQADLRALLEGMSVTPVADYAEPVEPTPVARITPGLWFRGVGAYIDRDDEEDGFTLDRKQTIWGGMAGFDFGTQHAGSVWLFGAFAGYLTSDLEFDETNTEWNYEGPTVGVYASYLDHAFHVDATVKVDFLDIEIDPEDLAPAADDADTNATNIGGRIDAGYKLGQTYFIEPQATLAVVHTEIDDVDIFGGTVEFDDATSVRGRLGLRVGFDQPASDGTVYSGDVTASVWEDFSGDNDVTITDTGVPDFGASVDPGETYGDLALGFSVAAPEGWSGFLRGNYLFANDYEAITGNAGVRYAW